MKHIIIKVWCFFIVFFLFSTIQAATTQDLNLNCKSNIAINADDGTVLYEKNSTSRVYPASTTKILTAIIAIETLDLQEEITITPEMVAQIPYNSSVMGVMENDIYTVEDLLYGLLLESGNDVAIVLADRISGNMDQFAMQMNEKLKQLGCVNTHFTNSHGYHDDNHYTTVQDMAILFQYCLKNPTFKTIISTREKQVSPTNQKGKVLTLENSNAMLDEESAVYCKEIVGGKTGFTYEAEGTFIGYAVKGDMTIIIGSFGGPQNISARFSDTKKIADYIFEHYEKVTLAKKGDFSFSYLDQTHLTQYTLAVADDIVCILPKEYILTYSIDIKKPENNTFLYQQNIGNITFHFLQDSLTYKAPLIVTNNLPISTAPHKNFIILLIFGAILLLIYQIKRIRRKKKRNKYDYHYRHRKKYECLK